MAGKQRQSVKEEDSELIVAKTVVAIDYSCDHCEIDFATETESARSAVRQNTDVKFGESHFLSLISVSRVAQWLDMDREDGKTVK